MIPISRPSIGEEELSKVAEVFKTGWLGMGAVTYEFEEKIKTFLGSKNVVATNTGTSAIHLALDALVLKKGDEVIVPSFIERGHVLLDHGVGGAYADVPAGEDIDRTGGVVGGDGHLVDRGEDGDFVRFGDAAGPDQVGHDDTGGAVFDKVSELPAGQQALGDTHRGGGGLL